MHLIADTVAAAGQNGLGCADLLLHQQDLVVSTVNLSYQSTGTPQIVAAGAIFDALAPPPVKPNRSQSSRRTVIRRKQRTKRITEGSGEDYWLLGGDGGVPFGGGGFGNWDGGDGWNFGGFGEQNWDESSSWSWFSLGFAFRFVCDVIYWIAFSTCVHFAFKRVVRIYGWDGR